MQSYEKYKEMIDDVLLIETSYTAPIFLKTHCLGKSTYNIMAYIWVGACMCRVNDFKIFYIWKQYFALIIIFNTFYNSHLTLWSYSLPDPEGNVFLYLVAVYIGNINQTSNMIQRCITWASISYYGHLNCVADRYKMLTNFQCPISYLFYSRW